MKRCLLGLSIALLLGSTSVTAQLSIEPWNAEVFYEKGAVVEFDGRYYQAKWGLHGVQPDPSASPYQASWDDVTSQYEAPAAGDSFAITSPLENQNFFVDEEISISIDPQGSQFEQVDFT